MIEPLVQLYIDMITYCIPFCVVFGFGNMAISTVMRAVFGGKLVIK